MKRADDPTVRFLLRFGWTWDSERDYYQRRRSEPWLCEQTALQRTLAAMRPDLGGLLRQLGYEPEVSITSDGILSVHVYGEQGAR